MFTHQVWDPTTQNPLQDLDGSNALVTDYLMGNRIDEPLGRVAGGATHAFLGDQVMSIRGLVDSAGAQTNRYTYAVFGLGRSQVEAVTNRLRFTARELDPSTGLQFNRWRHYVPAIGRFTQPDPLGVSAGTNVYLYALANPLRFTDSDGRQVAEICVIFGCGLALYCCLEHVLHAEACTLWCQTTRNPKTEPQSGGICFLPKCNCAKPGPPPSQ